MKSWQDSPLDAIVQPPRRSVRPTEPDDAGATGLEPLMELANGVLATLVATPCTAPMLGEKWLDLGDDRAAGRSAGYARAHRRRRQAAGDLTVLVVRVQPDSSDRAATAERQCTQDRNETVDLH